MTTSWSDRLQNAGDAGSILGQGLRSHMLQAQPGAQCNTAATVHSSCATGQPLSLRATMRILHATTKTQCRLNKILRATTKTQCRLNKGTFGKNKIKCIEYGNKLKIKSTLINYVNLGK